MKKICVQCSSLFAVSFEGAIYCGPRCFSQSGVHHVIVPKLSPYAHYVYGWFDNPGGDSCDFTQPIYIGRGDGYAAWRQRHSSCDKRLHAYSHTMTVVILGEYDKEDAKAVVRGLVRHYRSCERLVNVKLKESFTQTTDESIKHQLMIQRAINQLQEIQRVSVS